MTKKDYVLIAARFAAAVHDLSKEPGEVQDAMYDGIGLAAEHVADALAMDNVRFDRARFLAACGVQS